MTPLLHAIGYIWWAGKLDIPLSKGCWVPVSVEESGPHLICGSLGNVSLLSNGISIDSAIFKDIMTNTETEHAIQFLAIVPICPIHIMRAKIYRRSAKVCTNGTRKKVKMFVIRKLHINDANIPHEDPSWHCLQQPTAGRMSGSFP